MIMSWSPYSLAIAIAKTGGAGPPMRYLTGPCAITIRIPREREAGSFGISSPIRSTATTATTDVRWIDAMRLVPQPD